MIFNPVYGSGGSSPSLGTKTITANGTYNASSDNLDGYSQVMANVPNTYSAGDEGKVVSNGALVAQSSQNITQNGTYDTTLKNQVVVSVSGGSPNLQSKTGISITSNGSFSYTPDVGYDGLSEVSGTVNVPGGIDWQSITPIDLGAGSFIGSNNTFQRGNTTYTSYRSIAIDLSALTGKMIYIDNTANNRDYWGIYSAINNGATIKYPSGRVTQTSKKLLTYADDYNRLWQYLIYDYTSSNGNQPKVYAADITT